MTLACKALALTAQRRALCRSLDLDIAPGELWGVLGPNGSGKTTLMHTLAGMREPDAGTVLWSGRPLASYASRVRARHVGLLPQHEQAEFWGTALEYVLLGRYPQAESPLAWQDVDVSKSLSALEEAGVAALAERAYGTLSGGERQRVRIAQLLAQEARCMLLDEPLLHLDLHYQGHILTLMKRLAGQGRAVVMVLHDALWAARACSHALLLDGAGGTSSGTTSEVLTREALERLYACSLREFVDGGSRYLVPEI